MSDSLTIIYADGQTAGTYRLDLDDEATETCRTGATVYRLAGAAVIHAGERIGRVGYDPQRATWFYAARVTLLRAGGDACQVHYLTRDAALGALIRETTPDDTTNGADDAD